MTGRLRGVGVGPGDPELITLKAARLIGAADVVAYHQGVGRQSNARRIAAGLLPVGVIEEALQYPVTTGATDHPGGYDGAISDFYAECASRLAAHLDAGRDVVVISEGDPLFYGSFMYVFDLLRGRYETQVVPGVPAFAAATATAGVSLVRHAEPLAVLAGTMPTSELAMRLATGEAAVLIKLGRTFGSVVEALRRAGRLDEAVYVERASMDAERVLPVADVDPAGVPYFSLIVVPARPASGANSSSQSASDDELAPLGTTSAPLREGRPILCVLGLGPGPQAWLTPEARRLLDDADHIVGYGPYVDRVPHREGQRRHASGNTAEVDRARFALDLALAGEKVAVVSGGDAGVFGMASAVFEAAEDPRYESVDIHVAPGISAVQAVAAAAGAPIGADFAVVSLSDRLKPWDVIENRLRHIAQADLVLAIYNPASRSRTEQIARAREVLLEHRSPATVVVVGRGVGRPAASLTVTTLGDLDPSAIDMSCLVIVGATGTLTGRHGVWTPRFVPAN